MCEVSVVMVVDNRDLDVQDSILSVLKQSFNSLELILVDACSTHDLSSIVLQLNDQRVRLINKDCVEVDSFGFGVSNAYGKYIAFMDPNFLMHVDRLKIQHSFMQSNVDLAVCCSEVGFLGVDSYTHSFSKSVSGLIENSLLKFLHCGNFINYPSAMIRTEFLSKNKFFSDHSITEVFKLWIEIAKLGGLIYVDSLPLTIFRKSVSQYSKMMEEIHLFSSAEILDSVLGYMVKHNTAVYPELSIVLSNLLQLREKWLISTQDILSFYRRYFFKSDMNSFILSSQSN